VGRAHVAVVGARRAGGLLRVGRTVRPGPGAEVVLIALVDRWPAVDGARLEQVSRAGAAEAGAELGQVAGTSGRPADRAGVPGRMLARVAGAVACVGRAGVAVVRARRPAGRLRVRRAVRSVAGAEVVEVTFAHRRTAERRRG